MGPIYRPSAWRDNRPRNNETLPIVMNDVKAKITSKRLFRRSFLYQTKEFFNNSTLHGVRYIAETNRPFAERVIWFCLTAIGFISALVIIVSLWEKFQTNPTITGLDMDVHNEQIVFPTVAICPIEPFEMNRTVELAHSILGNSDEENVDLLAQFLIYLPQLTFENMGTAFKQADNFSKNQKDETSIDSSSLRRYTFEIGIRCNETIDACKYKDEEIKCCDHFYPVYSEHGLCFLFNPRYIDTVDAENINQKYHQLLETDKKWAIFFKPRRDVKIFVHSQYENFGWDFQSHVIWEPGIPVGPNQNWIPDFSIDLLISMKEIYTTDDAKQLSIDQRKCVFPGEIKLDYFDGEYTYTNCMKECRIKNCLKYCDCIPPFYRPIRTLKYCKPKELACIARHFSNITYVRNCQRCQLSCTNTVYEIEKLTKTRADPSKPIDIYVNIEYLTWPIIRYKRELLFGWIDLMVSFGGIGGLFLGFSLLSGVEIIYYFTIRAWCMLHESREVLYEIEVKQLMQPQEPNGLLLKLLKRRKDTKKVPMVRQIEVAEISSNLENNSHDKSIPRKMPDRIIDVNRTTRLAKRTLSMQKLNGLNRGPTSYDYAHFSGSYYIP